MINKLLLKSAFILLALLTLNGCRTCKDQTNPECDNYNPCAGKTPFNADFTIEERFTSLGSVFGVLDTSVVATTDTIVSSFGAIRAKFTAPDSYTSYYWTIGTDPTVFTTKSFSQFFPDPVSVDVTFIGTRTPDTLCFPNDDGVDTVVKKLTVVDYSQSPFMGNFYGTSTEKPDSAYTVSVVYQPKPDCSYWVTGLSGCNMTTFCGSIFAIGYNFAAYRQSESGNCNQRGFIYKNPETKIFTFKYQKANTPNAINYFTAIKVQ